MKRSKKRLNEIKNLPDSSINYSEIPELDNTFWEKATVQLPIKKKAISLRIDEDILDWYKSVGSGYQTLMNTVLKSYCEYQQSDSKNTKKS